MKKIFIFILLLAMYCTPISAGFLDWAKNVDVVTYLKSWTLFAPAAKKSNESKHFQCPKNDEKCLQGEQALRDHLKWRIKDLDASKGALIREQIENKNSFTLVYEAKHVGTEHVSAIKLSGAEGILPYRIEVYSAKPNVYSNFFAAWQKSATGKGWLNKEVTFDDLDVRCIKYVGKEIAQNTDYLQCYGHLPMTENQRTAERLYSSIGSTRADAIKFMHEHSEDFGMPSNQQPTVIAQPTQKPIVQEQKAKQATQKTLDAPSRTEELFLTQ